jgi:N-acyl-D-amino-acid deacylase
VPADLTIRNAVVLDGTGAPRFPADVAVDGGRITVVGDAPAGRVEVDAGGHVLAPGFVDTHTHDDGALLAHPHLRFKLAQGCTTLVVGNCGFSPFPASGSAGGLWGREAEGLADLASFRRAVHDARPACNAVALVGHNALRAAAMGEERRRPTPAEQARMRAWVEAAMADGACGLSSGLIYRPGRWADTGEVADLAGAAGAAGGLYATHMRNEGDRLLDAVDEALRIGRESGCGVHISHHKAAGRPNWGKVADSLAVVDEANAAGDDVTLDVYPYTAGSGRMIEYFDLDRPDPDLAAVIRLASCPAFPEYEGRMVVDIAADAGEEPAGVVHRILTAPRGDRTICIHFIIDEADIETNLRHPRMMIGSDGIPDLKGRPHPRLDGTMPRVLGEYVRERGVIPLEEAVRRMTALSCERFGLAGRGTVTEGAWADLVLFDPATIRDTATYDDPQQEPEGVALVVVNGEVAYDHGRHTGAGAGRLLRYGDPALP